MHRISLAGLDKEPDKNKEKKKGCCLRLHPFTKILSSFN